MKTIGQNIAFYRKEKNITQEALAEICGVSPQAVSKWENDVSCPDIGLLKTIARAFGISVDELLDDGQGPVTRLTPNVDTSKKIVRIHVTDGGNKVNVNLPFALVELLISNGNMMNNMSFGKNGDSLKNIDFKQISEMVSLGVVGKLVEVKGDEGETVEIWVE